MNTPFPVLFALSDSIYKSLPGTDVYDLERDALTWTGGCPVLAHPPCRAWSRLRHFSKHDEQEKNLAVWAVSQIRQFGGVLEHPAGSSLWPFLNLPLPGNFDEFGGFTFPVDQFWFGHKARKSTFLYIVGCLPGDLPRVPLSIDTPSYVVQSRTNKNHISRRDRLSTPLGFAVWLLDCLQVIYSRSYIG